jgi:hypothetical protein
MIIYNPLAFIFRDENQVIQEIYFVTILQYDLVEQKSQCYINMQLNLFLVIIPILTVVAIPVLFLWRNE